MALELRCRRLLSGCREAAVGPRKAAPPSSDRRLWQAARRNIRNCFAEFARHKSLFQSVPLNQADRPGHCIYGAILGQYLVHKSRCRVADGNAGALCAQALFGNWVRVFDEICSLTPSAMRSSTPRSFAGPDSSLEQSTHSATSVIRQRLEDCELALFDELQAGDILFLMDLTGRSPIQT